MGLRAPGSVSAYSVSFSPSARLWPRPRPLTPDPPLLPRRGGHRRPRPLDPAVSESEPQRPLRPLQGSSFGPAPPAEWGRGPTWESLEGPSDPSHTLCSRPADSSPRGLKFDSSSGWPSACPRVAPLRHWRRLWGKGLRSLRPRARQEGTRVRAAGLQRVLL